MKTEPTEKENLIEVLEVEISNCQDDLDAASWAYEEGILISKREATALLDLAQSSPKIKKLEWKETDYYIEARTKIGKYLTMSPGMSINSESRVQMYFGGTGEIVFDGTLGEAKAAAQADFEKRINESLE